MTVVAATVVTGAAVGVLAYVVLRLWPAHDPTLPEPPTGLVRVAFQHLRRGHTAETATRALLVLVGLIVVAGGVAVGAVHVMVREGWGLAPADRPVAEWAARHATSWSTDVLEVITSLGSTVVLLTSAVVTVAYERVRRHRPLGAAFMAAVVVGEWVVTNSVKWAVDRARPEIDPLSAFSGPSFPSGHTAGAAAILAAVALLLGRGRDRRHRDLLLAGAAGIAAAVAASRVLLGVHWLTDVVAGLVLGWCWFLACAFAFGGVRVRFGTPGAQVAAADSPCATRAVRPGG